MDELGGDEIRLDVHSRVCITIRLYRDGSALSLLNRKSVGDGIGAWAKFDIVICCRIPETALKVKS